MPPSSVSGSDHGCKHHSIFDLLTFTDLTSNRLNKVSEVSTETKILSFPSSLPIFVAPTALARLGHSGGEVNILRAAAAEGVIQAISNNASCSIEEVMAARSTNQPLFFQFYMNRNREASEAMLHKVEKSGFDVVLLTVDAAVPGKRERDQRGKGDFVVSGLPRQSWNKADRFIGSWDG